MFAARKTDNVSSAANYIEECFSVYLYTGNGSTQTITNEIDLSGKGGLVWIKSRNDTYDHFLYDTLRGATKSLQSSTTTAEQTYSDSLTAFNSTGFALGANVRMNANTTTYASWTFREQAKFFDVVTYTGNGSNRTIAHSLGSVPGCIIVKRTDTTADWQVYHRSLANTEYLVLNTTAAKATGATRWNSTTPTSTEFSLGTSTDVNANGGTYVAYLFAHDAGGFGPAGTDNVISCGSFTTDGSGNATVNLGYEPQWLLFKVSSTSGDWVMLDTMRGWSDGSDDARLRANTAVAEALSPFGHPTATGFKFSGGELNATYIYIAIRRGPMKTPTSGTSVFAPTIWTGNTANPTDTRSIAGFGKPTDLFIGGDRDTVFNHNYVYDRLRGTDSTGGKLLKTHSTDAETSAGSGQYLFSQMDGITLGDYNINYSGRLDVGWFFGRAPGFMDVVCYTGTGSTRTITHNLSVTPELVITKSRSQALGWVVWTTSLTSTDYWIRLDDTMAQTNSPVGYGGTFSASSYTIANTGPYGALNTSGATYVAYLFASVTGVSKVGSYTGNGSSQTINCGFTAGARFVMIKRTDSTGDWYVWDTARGIVSGNDPRLSINSTAAEVTTDDSIDPDNSGFIVNQLSATNINVNAASYIFLAVS